MINWKPVLFYLTLFLLIWAYAATAANYDFDLWARLIAGAGVVDGGHVLKADFLSYTPTHIWYDHEWGSGVIFYLFLKFFGPYSLIILQTMLIFGIFFIVSKVIKVRGHDPYNILFYFLAFMALIPTINMPVRCHLFSFLLFTLFIYILELARKGNDKPLYLIPIITIFWNNVHGGVVSGLGLIAMYAVGELWMGANVYKYIVTLFVSCLGLLINPWGWDYIKFLLMANTMHRADVSEWWGIFSKFHMFKWVQFKLFMVFIIAIEAIRRKMDDKVKLIVLLVTLCLAIMHLKLIPFFVIAACCYVYEDFEIPKHRGQSVVRNDVIVGLLLGISVFALAVKEFTVPLDFKAYPVQEVEFIKINNIKGNILTNFGLGSYVSYKLYPQNLIFMDGRYEEVYYDYMVPLLKKFYLVINKETPQQVRGDMDNNWDEVLRKFPPDCMIIEKYYPVYNVLKQSKDWALVYEGPVFGVFVKSAQKQYKQPSTDIEYYRERLFQKYE